MSTKYAAQDDTDVTDDESSSSPTHYNVSSFGSDPEVETLILRLQRADIIVPDWQRNYVWTLKEASRFIESLLLGLPVPGIFLAVDKDNKQLVIDGQQRLKTIQFFKEGVFNPKIGETRQTVFRLSLGRDKNDSRFVGETYESLDSRDRNKFDTSIIHATIIRQVEPADDDTSIYHIFERLNSGGRQLYPQEIRRVIYRGKLQTLLDDLNENEDWRSIFGKKHSRLKDQELILRFIAFSVSLDEYERPINSFLNKFAKLYTNPKDADIQQWSTWFSDTVGFAISSLGPKAFRPDGPLNAAVFDSVMVALMNRLLSGTQLTPEKAKECYDKLIQDVNFRKLFSSATSDDENVKKRFQLAKDALMSC